MNNHLKRKAELAYSAYQVDTTGVNLLAWLKAENKVLLDEGLADIKVTVDVGFHTTTHGLLLVTTNMFRLRRLGECEPAEVF